MTLACAVRCHSEGGGYGGGYGGMGGMGGMGGGFGGQPEIIENNTTVGTSFSFLSGLFCPCSSRLLTSLLPFPRFAHANPSLYTVQALSSEQYLSL